MTGKVMSEGVNLIERWKNATAAVKNAKRDLNQAEVEAANAESDLAKWLLPNDAKPEEKFSVWHGNELIEVTAASSEGYCYTDAKVTIRK